MKTSTHGRSTEQTPLGSGTMTAIVQDHYGTVPEEVLRMAEVPLPAVGDDEVLVRVRAASVDRGTWHIMTGLPRLMRVMGFGLRRPRQSNPGRCLAGTVEAVGESVTEFEPGDEVYGTADGSFARYASAKAGKLAASRRTCRSSKLPPSRSRASRHCRACAIGLRSSRGRRY